MNKQILESIFIEKCPTCENIPRGIEYIVTAEICTSYVDIYQEIFQRYSCNYREILIVTFYKRKNMKPQFRVFANRKTFITELITENRWSNSMVERLLPYGWSNKVMFANENSKTCGVEYLFSSESNTLNALVGFQEHIRKEQLEAKHNRLQMRTDAIMNQIKEIPKDINSWINDVPLLKSRYIYYKRHGRKINGFCTACKKDVMLESATHNAEGICPSCKSKIKFKAEGKSKNIYDNSKMAIVQKGEGKLENSIIVRCFSISRNYYEHYRRPDTNYYEDFRYVIKNNTVYMFEYTSVYNSLLHGWDKEKWHQKKTPDASGDYYLYTNNIESILKDTPWQYCCIKEYALHEGNFKVLKYFDEYLRYPSVEYLIKLKLFKIANEVLFLMYGYYSKRGINPSGKNLKDVLGVGKADIAFVQKNNISSDELLLYKGLKQVGQIMDEELLLWIRKNLDCYFEMEMFICLANYTNISKAIKYIDQQYTTNRIKKANIIRDWEDYIENSTKLKYDLKNPMILFPKNLIEAHDRVVDILKKKEQAQFNKAIVDMENELNDMFLYENKEYIIRAPHSVDEIVSEGAKLSHCVATYIEKISNKKTNILFIRNKENPDEPFYTLEIKDFKIIQVRGKGNRDTTPGVQNFVDKWKAKVLDKQIKTRINIPA